MAQSADVSSTRYALDSEEVLRELGPLRKLSGTWEGQGFNLIARPDFRDKANLYLQLNQTHETLTITPIRSAIPNRGFGQDDIELFGLSYLQKIHDHHTGGALHLEPGLWITQPSTTYPPQKPPADGRIIARMASIPHGTAVLAQGNATGFTGAPTLPTMTQIYNGSVFHSFNSTPFAANPPVINAVGSSEKRTAAQISVQPFKEYDVLIYESAAHPRTPFATCPPEPPLPQQVKGVPMQDVINDPIRLLQAVIEEQIADDCTFEGFALNIATRAVVTFRQYPDSPPPGLWITQPGTTYPPEKPPPNGWIIARMASIPHGSAVLARGSATSFTGAPTLRTGTQAYNGSVFRSFNSTPFYADPPIINAPESSQKLTAKPMSMPRFKQYDVSIPASAANPRTPFAVSPPERSLPEQIDGVPIQQVINDPIRLLQAVIEQQKREGCAFEGFALNIATEFRVAFRLKKNSPRSSPTVNVRVIGGAGGIENILFLER